MLSVNTFTSVKFTFLSVKVNQSTPQQLLVNECCAFTLSFISTVAVTWQHLSVESSPVWWCSNCVESCAHAAPHHVQHQRTRTRTKTTKEDLIDGTLWRLPEELVSIDFSCMIFLNAALTNTFLLLYLFLMFSSMFCFYFLTATWKEVRRCLKNKTLPRRNSETPHLKNNKLKAWNMSSLPSFQGAVLLPTVPPPGA